MHNSESCTRMKSTINGMFSDEGELHMNQQSLTGAGDLI